MPRTFHAAGIWAGLGFTAALSAQVSLPPCVPTPPAADPAFGPVALSTPGFPVRSVAQLELRPDPSLPSGNYILSASVRFVAGGAGGHDLLMGRWNAATGFAKTNWVDALNTVDDEFALTLSPGATTVVFDRYVGTTVAQWTASRSAPTGAFGAARSVSGIPVGSVDPSFGLFGAREVLFFTTRKDIRYGDFDSATGTVSNLVVCAAMPAGMTDIHSPRPVDDRSGQTRGLIFVAQDRTGSVAYYDPDPRDAHQNERVAQIIPPGGNFLANPDANGGTLRYAHAMGAGYVDPLRVDTFLVNSTCATPVGGNVTVTLFAPQKTGTPYVAALALGPVAAAPSPLPCVSSACPNPCAIGVSPIVVLTLGLVDLEAGDAAVTFPVPAGLPLGAAVALQGFFLDFAAPGAHSSNLGRLRIQPSCR